MTDEWDPPFPDAEGNEARGNEAMGEAFSPAGEGEGEEALAPLSIEAARRRRQGGRRARQALTVAVVAVFAAAIGAGVGRGLGPGPFFPWQPPGSGAVALNAAPLSTAAIAAKVEPAVVDITVTLAYGEGAAAGTGMILSPSGLVLTNNHVIEDASAIRVTLPATGRSYAARVVGVDPSADVAVLKLIGASHLPTVPLGDSATVTVGERVVAIGNALALSGPPTVTRGTVTALDRSITASDPTTGSETLVGLMETDAALAPGDSGGPLVDAKGQVIGMDTAADRTGAEGAFSNVGFAIPIDTALKVARSIVSGKGGPGILIGARPFLGVEVAPIGTAPSAPVAQGALVLGVIPGTAAAAAGIAPGDVIVSFAGQSVASVTDLTNLILKEHPGAMVRVTWVAPDGQALSARVRLGSGPAA